MNKNEKFHKFLLENKFTLDRDWLFKLVQAEGRHHSDYIYYIRTDSKHYGFIDPITSLTLGERTIHVSVHKNFSINISEHKSFGDGTGSFTGTSEAMGNPQKLKEMKYKIGAYFDDIREKMRAEKKIKKRNKRIKELLK